MIERHGPLDCLSALDRQVISIVCKLLIETRTAPHDEVAKLASSISNLTATLPTPPADEEPEMDIGKLNDAEVNELLRLQCIMAGQSPPTPGELLQPLHDNDQQLTPRERTAVALAHWLDARECEAIEGRLHFDQRAVIHVENEVSALFCPIIARSVLWARIRDEERAAAVSAAVIATEDRLTKATASQSQAASVNPEPAPEPPDNVLSILGYSVPTK